ncbi:DoxX family protein [Rhizobium sp. RU36D]|uniref:DoxX family protein n=1 Tax=Rhizobium sp. RU36D TaxID=1907415 RepID=UPI0009D82544|nr:DoxX family protein [Rhizobium sp. RU36D]SMC98005.1 DoxX-like family protein [Rhizobium sp. RU36D]
MSAYTTQNLPAKSKKLEIALWGVQTLLALFYGFAGFTKVSTAPADLVSMGMAYAADVPAGLLLFVGTAEILGALGLLLPGITKIKPVLTPLAAIGLSTIQILAIGLHALRGEWSVLPMNLVVLGLSLFIVWGRMLRKA